MESVILMHALELDLFIYAFYRKVVYEMYLGIYGAGSLGKEIFDIAMRVNEKEDRWNNIFFLDDIREEKEYYLGEVKRIYDFVGLMDELDIVIANGIPHNRKLIYDKVKALDGHLVNLIDPTVIVSPTARLGEGIIIKPYAQVLSDADIGDNVLIHSYVAIGHDICIGSHSNISTETSIGGKSVIEEEVFVGLGCSIRDGVHIGRHAVVSMGSVVQRDVESDMIVMGNPARVFRKNNDDLFK